MAQDIVVQEIGGVGCEPIGGLAHLEIRIAPVDWFTAIGEPKPLCDPIPANEATTFEEMIDITTDHTFAVGKGFMKLKGIEDTVGIESAMIGNAKRRLFENKLSVLIAGSDAKRLGFTRWAKNKDFIVLATEIESGRTRQLGTSRRPASISELTGKIDPTPEGDNAAAFVFSDKQVYEAPIYKGIITDAP